LFKERGRATRKRRKRIGERRDREKATECREGERERE
jgi:hypothetical protein